jgi:hypothetical protein
VRSRDARVAFYGYLAIFGVPLVGLLWLISVTTYVVWVFLGLLVCVVLLVFVGVTSKDQEAKRKGRVRSLQHQVSRFKSEVATTRSTIGEAMSLVYGGSRIHEVPPLERRLAEQQKALAKSRAELSTIWKQSDGYMRESEESGW